MNNITIIKREESDDQIRYCEIHGTKWINRMKLPEHKRMSKGDIFNVYRREYKTDAEGNITEWICDTKHGCEYDGKSIESSLASLDNELGEYYTSSTYQANVKAGVYKEMLPLC